MEFVFRKTKKAGQEEYGSIYARIRKDGRNNKYALGFIIRAHEWEKVKSMQYTSTSMMTSIGLRYDQFASILVQIKSAFEHDFNPDLAKEAIHTIKVKTIMGENYVPETHSEEKILLHDYVKRFIEELKSGKRLKHKRNTKVSTNYIRTMNTLLNDLLKYQKTNHRRMTVDSVIPLLVNDFSSWLVKKGNKPNTIRCKIISLNTIAKSAYEEHLTDNDAFSREKFIPAQEPVDSIYLTSGRITELRNLQLNSRDSIMKLLNNSGMTEKKIEMERRHLCDRRIKTLNLARDMFVVGCMTGQRFSDYRRIGKDMLVKIKDGSFLKIKQEKTKKTVYVPINNTVLEIINKYDGAFPYIQMDTVNKILKLLGELLHWTEKVKMEGYKKKKKFCEMLSTHTARRSFATNAYASGVPLSSIMAVTGHGSERMLRKYLRLNETEKAIIALNDFEGFFQM